MFKRESLTNREVTTFDLVNIDVIKTALTKEVVKFLIPFHLGKRNENVASDKAHEIFD